MEDQQLEEEVRKLMEEQLAKNASAKPAVKKETPLDVQLIQDLYQDCFALPKIELHAHIGGCLRPETFMELAMNKGIDIDHIDFYNVDIKTAFDIFRAVNKVLTDLPTLARVVRDIVADYAKQNCVYLELRSTPKIFPGSTSLRDYVDTVTTEMRKAEEEHNIKVRYIISINRMYPDNALPIAQLAVDYASHPYVVGLELSGDPRCGRFEDFIPALSLAKSAGLKIAIHCSEMPEQAKETPEMFAFGPDRLGHCIFMTSEEIKEAAEREIPVELCVSSNVATTQCGVPALLPHLHEFWKVNHNLVICCDDTMLFGTNISLEMFEFAKAVKATTIELKSLLMRNAEHAIFAKDDETKEWVKQQVAKFPVRGIAAAASESLVMEQEAVKANNE